MVLNVISMHVCISLAPPTDDCELFIINHARIATSKGYLSVSLYPSILAGIMIAKTKKKMCI